MQQEGQRLEAVNNQLPFGGGVLPVQGAGFLAIIFIINCQ